VKLTFAIAVPHADLYTPRQIAKSEWQFHSNVIFVIVRQRKDGENKNRNVKKHDKQTLHLPRKKTRQANTTSSQKKNTTSKHYISRDVLVAGSLRSCRVPMVLVSAGISKHNRLRTGVGHFRSRLHEWRMAAQPDCSGR